MSEQGAQAVEQAISALGESQTLPGEGADRKYVVDGRAWRVRVQLIDSRQPAAPVNGEPTLSPVSYGIGVSVALLDENDAVATDGSGWLLVFDQHPVGIQAGALANPDYDPAQALDHAIAQEISAAAALLKGKQRLAAALEAWTVAPEDPAQEEKE